MIARMREMNFLHAGRARAWLRVLALGLALWLVTFLLVRHGWIDRSGDVSATDFVAYWSAASLAHQGQAQLVYQAQPLSSIEHAVVPLKSGFYSAFFYPPTYLLLCLPLALVPYLAALLTFSAAGLAAFIAVLRKFLPAHGTWLLILAYPGLLVTLGCGQNGLFSAALIGLYGVTLEQNPYLAGVGLGVLACKPQLALAVPVLLLAARRPAPLIGAAASFLLLFVVSGEVLGWQSWVRFFQNLPAANAATAVALVDPSKLVTINQSVRAIGLGAPVALVAQGIFAIAGMAAAGFAGWRRAGGKAEAAMLAAVCLLITPHAADYDLPVTSIAMAFVFTAARQGGFLAWEKLILLMAYLLPLLAHGVAARSHFQIAPLVVAALAWICFERVRRAAPVTL